MTTNASSHICRSLITTDLVGGRGEYRSRLVIPETVSFQPKRAFLNWFEQATITDQIRIPNSAKVPENTSTPQLKEA